MGRALLVGFMLFLFSLVPFTLAFLGFFGSLLGFTVNYVYFMPLFFYLLLASGILVLVDFIYLSLFPVPRKLRFEPINNVKVSVGMTAYNDEDAVGPAVKDFLKHPKVCQVIVVDNNCADNTAEVARKAGAKVVKETVQGYGAACIRALKEARKTGNVVCLVEGDQTFSAADLDKLLSYLENVDMVLGTRTTAEIIAPDSQVNRFIRYGNIFIAKLIQMRYWSRLRLTDVGCTFRVIRPEALGKIINQLNVTGSDFSPHMILAALKNNLKIIEVPVTLKKRAGISKGVGSSIPKGLLIGFRMWKQILLD